MYFNGGVGKDNHSNLTHNHLNIVTVNINSNYW